HSIPPYYPLSTIPMFERRAIGVVFAKRSIVDLIELLEFIFRIEMPIRSCIIRVVRISPKTIKACRINASRRIVKAINISIECLRISRLAGSYLRIYRSESAEAVFVHSGFGEVE